MRSSNRSPRFWGMALGVAGAGLAMDARAADPKEWGDESAASDEAVAPKPSATPAPDAAPPGGTPSEGTPSEGTPSEGAPSESSEAAPADGVSWQDTHAADSPTTLTLGARYRGVFLPAGVLHAFIDGGESVYSQGVGPEFSIRKEDVEFVLSAWLAFHSLGPVAIKGTNDAEEAWEIVESDLKALYLTFDYLWNTPLASGLELSYGAGAGLGITFGNLYRTQATLAPGGTIGNPDDYVPCAGINQPPQGGYCDDINDHYNGYAEPSWFNGGAKPSLLPWLAGQIGLRYQPHPKIVSRLDVGLAVSGIFFGVGVDYAL